MAAPVHADHHHGDADPGHSDPGAPRAGASGTRGWVAPVAVGVLGAGACAAVALWNPADGGTPLCWSQGLFGVDCPFCGGLRCANSLLRGDWSTAADHNVLFAVLLPLAAVSWVLWLVQSLRDRPLPRPRVARGWWVAVAVFLLAFTLARNSDANAVFSWLHSTASTG